MKKSILLVFTSMMCVSCASIEARFVNIEHLSSSDDSFPEKSDNVASPILVQYKNGFFFEEFKKNKYSTAKEDYIFCIVKPEKVDGVAPEKWILKDGEAVSIEELEDYSILELHCKHVDLNLPTYYSSYETIYIGTGEEVPDTNIYFPY